MAGECWSLVWGYPEAHVRLLTRNVSFEMFENGVDIQRVHLYYLESLM